MATRHRRDMTEILLKTTLNLNKQQHQCNIILIFHDDHESRHDDHESCYYEGQSINSDNNQIEQNL